MCVSIYIHLTFVISIPFINYAVCNLSKTFYKREGEILAKIGNEKYRLTLILLRDPSSIFHDSCYIKKLPQKFGRYFAKNVYF